MSVAPKKPSDSAFNGINVARSLTGNVWVCALVSIVGASLFAATHLQTGWFPHDEGQLGQAAERVLDGQMPHRDFDDMYTGGQTYLNALSFKWFGLRSESIRWMLWIFFVPFVASIFWISKRVTTPLNAGLVTFFCGAITLPVNSPALPSWYNLFFMVYGMVCFLKFLDRQKTIWLLAAGLIAGCSILIKITGVYFVAGGMLFLVNYEQLQESNIRKKSFSFSIFVTACLFAFGVLGLVFSSSQDWLMTSVHLTLPMWMLAVITVRRQFKTENGDSIFRFKRLVYLQVPFLFGALIPVMAFTAFYWQAGAIGSLYEGVFVLPRMRVSQAGYPFPALPWLLCSLPIAGVLLLGFVRKLKLPGFVRPLSLAVIVVLVAAWGTELGFKMTFQSLRNLAPFVAAVSFLMLLDWKSQRLSHLQQNQLFLVSGMMVMGSLIQFPYANDLYFFFLAPLVVLVVLFITEFQVNPLRKAHPWLFGMFLLLAVMRMNSFSPIDNVRGFPSTERAQSVGLERCSLVVDDYVAQNYQTLVREIQSRSLTDEYIYAGPDFPEAYFLAERKNPTRIFYDFFRPEFQTNLQNVADIFNRKNVKLVVLKNELEFSKLTPEFEHFIQQTFPNRKPIDCVDRKGRERDPQFVIYWRD